jgi:1,4-alpha-glucan branching enzyme
MPKTAVKDIDVMPNKESETETTTVERKASKQQEILKIVEGSHGNPHNILGMREVATKTAKSTKTKLEVGVFCPGADAVWVFDETEQEKPDKYHSLKLIHIDGFFEGMFPSRDKWFRYKLRVQQGESIWEFHDPYSFMPVITDMDLHLFGEGTHYEIYEKLGCHPMTIDGVDGALFAVWAPNAKRVSVVGEFNNWDGRRHPMRVLQNSGIWELFIPGLHKYDKYRFEIKTYSDQILHKQDPYGNFHDMRPSTASLVYDINNYHWNDYEWRHKKEHPLAGPINIYEVHMGSWRKAGADREGYGGRFMTYRELADELVPYLVEMNYTHIELMPIMEYPYDASWGYQVTGYFAATSRYGNPDDLMFFIDKCHQNSIGVILDWVPAHFPKDAHGLINFDGSALYEHADNRKGDHPEWGTKIFNYGRKEVKNFLIANALFWLDKYHIDGLRVDAVASMLYLDYGKNGNWLPNHYGGRDNIDAVEFIKHMNSIILGKYPNTLMCAEESTSWEGVTRPAELDGLGFNLKWNMGWMNDFLKYVSYDSIYKKYHHNNLTFAMIYAFSENFVLVLSHDEVVHGKRSMIGKMPGDLWQKFANLRTALGYMYCFPGKKLLFMGSEFGQFDEWWEEKALCWFLLDYEHHNTMHGFTRDLNALYKKDRPLWYDDFGARGFEWIQCDDAQHSIISFVRYSDDDLTICICNFTPAPYYAHRIGVPQAGKYVEVLNSDDAKYWGSGVVNPNPIMSDQIAWDNRDNSIEFKLPPLGCVVFKVEG